MARDFNGTTSRVYNDGGVSGIDSTTLSFRLLTDINAVSGDHVILITSQSISAGHCCVLRWTYVSGDPVLYFIAFHSTTNGVWRSTAVQSINTVYDVVWTYDNGSTANDPVLYIDGVSQGITEVQAPAGTPTTSIDSVVMGRQLGSFDYFDGQIAEVGIWDVVLSAAQVESLCEPHIQCSYLADDLQANWPLLEGLNELIQGADLTDDNSADFEHFGIVVPHGPGGFLGKTIAPAGIALTPSPVSISLSIPTPTIGLGALDLTPSPVTMPIALPTPVIGLGALTLAPSPVTMPFMLPTPVIDFGQIMLTPSSVVMPIALPAPTIGFGTLDITPSPVAMPFAVPTPSVSSALNLSPSPIALSLVLPAPSIGFGALNLSPSPIAMAFALPTPVLAGFSAAAIVYTRGTIQVPGQASTIAVPSEHGTIQGG